MPAAIRRHPEAMSLRFSDSPYEVSEEFADNFVVDFSSDDQVIGLEIVWSDSYRKGSEPALLAFALFGSALVWLGYHYAGHSGPEMCWAVLRKIKQFVSATDSRLRVANNSSTGLTVTDEDGKLLLCADLQYYPQRFLKSANAPKSIRNPALPTAQMEEIRSAINRLKQTVLPANPGAVGVAVAIDELSNLRYRQPINPGRWITWPESPRNIWAHIAIIPPTGCVYPWLPEGFLPSRGAVNAASPSDVIC